MKNKFLILLSLFLMIGITPVYAKELERIYAHSHGQIEEKDNYFSTVTATSDGGYITAGLLFDVSACDCSDPTDKTSFITKYDKYGNISWTKIFEGQNFYLNSLYEVNGNYLLVDVDNLTTILDSNGEIVWENTDEDIMYYLMDANENGILVDEYNDAEETDVLLLLNEKGEIQSELEEPDYVSGKVGKDTIVLFQTTQIVSYDKKFKEVNTLELGQGQYNQYYYQSVYENSTGNYVVIKWERSKRSVVAEITPKLNIVNDWTPIFEYNYDKEKHEEYRYYREDGRIIGELSDGTYLTLNYVDLKDEDGNWSSKLIIEKLNSDLTRESYDYYAITNGEDETNYGKIRTIYEELIKSSNKWIFTDDGFYMLDVLYRKNCQLLCEEGVDNSYFELKKISNDFEVVWSDQIPVLGCSYNLSMAQLEDGDILVATSTMKTTDEYTITGKANSVDIRYDDKHNIKLIGEDIEGNNEVNIRRTEHGILKADYKISADNTIIQLELLPDEGYECDYIVITDATGRKIELSDDLSFEMPNSDIEIKVVWKENNPETSDYVMLGLLTLTIAGLIFYSSKKKKISMI